MSYEYHKEATLYYRKTIGGKPRAEFYSKRRGWVTCPPCGFTDKTIVSEEEVNSYVMLQELNR